MIRLCKAPAGVPVLLLGVGPGELFFIADQTIVFGLLSSNKEGLTVKSENTVQYFEIMQHSFLMSYCMSYEQTKLDFSIVFGCHKSSDQNNAALRRVNRAVRKFSNR